MKSFAIGLALTACIWTEAAAAAPAAISPGLLYAAPLGNGMCMAAGLTYKPLAGKLVIPFGLKFSLPPVVTTSSFWFEPQMPVNVVDTIVDLKQDQFTVDIVNKSDK